MDRHAAPRHARHAARRRLGFGRVLRSTRVRALLSLGIVFGFGATGTLAYWTDTSTVTGATFTAGTLDLQLNDHQGTLADPAGFTTTLGMTDMVPGSSVAAMLPVQNKSSGANLTYTMTGGASGTLGAALHLQLFSGGTASNTAGVGTCNGTQIGTDITLTNTNTTPIISTGRGPLAASTGVENLCFRVELPTTADTSLQSATSAATFIFTATSVAP